MTRGPEGGEAALTGVAGVDVAIVGGGLAGSALAVVLAKQGRSVALCDLHERYPVDFRAEKLTATQMRQLDRLDLGDAVRRAGLPIAGLAIARRGRIVERRPNSEFGIDYADLVNTIRARIPASVGRARRVAGIEASADRQRVHVAGGGSIDARLVVVATGLGKNLFAGLGIERRIVQSDHCLAIGFDLLVDDPTGRPLALTYHGERVGDGSAYLTMFPLRDRLRANLFVYRGHKDDWPRAFAERTRETLLALMPGLPGMLGDFAIPGRVVMRPIDLLAAEHHRRDGVVLVGDAFATTCPTGGTGIDKVLTDVERLATLIPGWLATPGMARDKIERFYDDPAKVACDAAARRMVAYAKGMAVDPGIGWTMRRYRNFYAQTARDWLRRRLAGAGGTAHGTQAAARR